MGLIAERLGMVSGRGQEHHVRVLRTLTTPSSPHAPACTPPPQLEPLKAWVAARKPTWGTCAGLIMLAARATGTKAGGQTLLGGLDVDVHRNYFGAQLASFEAPLELAEAGGVRDAVLGAGAPAGGAGAGGVGGAPAFNGVFIRAPAILSVGPSVTPIAWVTRQRRDANVPELPSSAPAGDAAARVIVAARDAAFLVTAFHPELTESPGFHRLFAAQVEAATGKTLLGAGGAFDPRRPMPLVGGGFTGAAGGPGGANDVTSGNSGSLLIARRVVPGVSPI